jgi:two-component system, response regulator YesN
VQDLYPALRRVVVILDQERAERENLKRLRSQVENNLVLQREKFLLRLLLGGESSTTAIEQSQQLGMDILARWYVVIVIKIDFNSTRQPLEYKDYQQVEALITTLVVQNMGAILTRKDIEELVLILKGENKTEIQQEGAFLADLVRQEVESKIACRLIIGMGEPQQRLGDLHHSFSEALLKVQGSWTEMDNSELRKVNQAPMTHYLESGLEEEFDSFFDTYFQPFKDAIVRSKLFKQYIILEIILSAAQFISDLGRNVDQVIPERLLIEEFLARLTTFEEIKSQTRNIFLRVISFRDQQTNNGREMIIHQARAYIDKNYGNAELSLNEVATQVNFSPNHFSAVFSEETGETFKDYLTRIRIEEAKKLLRTTGHKISEVAVQCGYNDPHYFSQIFRKGTGLTPQQFREAPKKDIKKADK